MNVNVVNLMLCESYLKNLSFSCLDVFPLSEVSLPELIVGLEAFLCWRWRVQEAPVKCKGDSWKVGRGAKCPLGWAISTTSRHFRKQTFAYLPFLFVCLFLRKGVGAVKAAREGGRLLADRSGASLSSLHQLSLSTWPRPPGHLGSLSCQSQEHSPVYICRKV